MEMKMDNLADPMEGVEEYIAEHTSLPIEVVRRIYRLGDPWPPSHGGLNLGQDAREATGKSEITMEDIVTVWLALIPLLAMDTEPCPIVIEHIEKVANLSGAEEETVCQIYNGMVAFLGEAISRVEAKAEELQRQQADGYHDAVTVGSEQ
jgi:hypothetical protein